MKKKMRRILSLMVVLILFAWVFQVGAYYTYYNHVLIGGVSNIQFYVYNSALPFASIISGAAESWTYSMWANPVYLTRTYTLSQSEIDAQAAVIAPDNDYYQSPAYCTYYNSQGLMKTPFDGNWNFCVVIIDLGGWFPREDYKQQACIAHEMGHAFGLAHNFNNQYCIMNTHEYRLVNVPWEDDNNGVNALY